MIDIKRLKTIVLISLAFLTLIILSSPVTEKNQNMNLKSPISPDSESSASTTNLDLHDLELSEPIRNVSDAMSGESFSLIDPPEDEAFGGYQLVWEPNRVQGSVHAVAVLSHPYTPLIAIAAGYFYDNEIHVFQWDPGNEKAWHVWDCGDGIITSDVLSLVFADTDLDYHAEIVAGSADGKIYVFEQKSRSHEYVGYHEFQLVWTSQREVGIPVSSVKKDDLDSDLLPEIVAGSWDGKVYVFEYDSRYATPGSPSHWHNYVKVWDSGETIDGRVNSIATGDTDIDGFREVIVGSSNCKLYIFENNQSAIGEFMYPHQDNVYVEVWNSSDLISGSIWSVAVSNYVDDDPYGEIVAVSCGYGACVFDYNPSSQDYVMNKLLRPVEGWEEVSPYPIDPYIDLKVRGNETDGVFEPSIPASPPVDLGPEYPENKTAAAGPKDLIYTLLNASAAKGMATIVLDFGKDEEMTGAGNKKTDLKVYGYRFFDPKLNEYMKITTKNVEFYVSRDNTNFSRVEEGITIATDAEYIEFHIDIDPTLMRNKWEFFRYLKIQTTTAFNISHASGVLYRPVTQALTAFIGYIPGLNASSTDYRYKIILGTVDGRLMVFRPLEAFGPETYVQYTQSWDSFAPIPLYQPGTMPPQTRKRLSMNATVWSISLLPVFPKTYMITGTYPEVSAVFVNTTTLEASEIWDTSNVLDGWTSSVTIADIDGDGKREVVVGSFDNNIYTFENVYSNTYRRAWRSPDLKHNETFWDHVTDLIVADTDQDGMMEIIAANNNVTYPQLYVFENIGNDQHIETQRIHLPAGTGPISAINFGDDLDGDGAKEIVVAAKNNIYVYEDTTLAWNVAFPTSPYRYMVRSVVTGDTDKDGLGEIICGGLYVGVYVYGHCGFLYIYENNGMNNQYQQIAWAPPYDHRNNCPINDIVLGDQDEDGQIEIVVGHEKGVNVYENTGNDAYETAHILTSSATYPPIQRNPVTETTPPNELIDNPPAIMQLKNGTFIIAYENNLIDPVTGFVSYSYIYTSISSDGVTWSPGTRISEDTDYEFYPASNVSEIKPSMIEYPNGTIWITYWVLGDIYVVSNDGTGWTTPLCANPRPPNPTDATALGGPSIWHYVHAPPTLEGPVLGVCWVGQNHSLFIAYYAKELWFNPDIGDWDWRYYWEDPIAVNSLIGAGFYAYSSNMIALKDLSYVTVFYGFNSTSAKLDYDVFIMFSNDTINWSPPFNITIASTYEKYPSIIQMGDESLIAVYQTMEASIYYVYTVVSTNGGISWGKTQVLEKGTLTGTAPRPAIAQLNNDGFVYAYVSYRSDTQVYSIYAGVNPVYGWWSTTIGPASCLALGDTDSDSQREIIAGSGKNVYIFELNTTTQLYSQKWVSQRLAQLITDIAIADINNSGFQEILVTAEGGNLYAFEWVKERNFGG